MPSFSVDGLQYYGVMFISNNQDGGVTTSFFEIFNNTTLVVSGNFNPAPSSPIFNITDNASIYNIATTITPVDLNMSAGFISYFLSPEFDGNQTVTMRMQFQEEGLPLQDYSIPDGVTLSFYINIQFIPL